MEMHVSLVRRGGLTARFYRQIRGKIADGLLRPGEAVPSTEDPRAVPVIAIDLRRIRWRPGPRCRRVHLLRSAARFGDTPFLGLGEANWWFPDHALSASCAEWAATSSVAFVREFVTDLAITTSLLDLAWEEAP